MFFVELERDPSKQSKSSVEKPPESFSKYVYIYMKTIITKNMYLYINTLND